MAKFYLEDGSIKSDEQIMREYYNDNNYKYIGIGDDYVRNSEMLMHKWIGDILKNMSNNLHSHDENIDKKCVLDLLTGKRHTCNLKTVIDEKTGKEIKIKDCEYCIMKWENDEHP
jgi:hypothetical protein